MRDETSVQANSLKPKVSTRVLPPQLLDAVKRSPLVYGVARRARFAVGSMLGARAVSGIPGRCHYNDFMLSSSAPEDTARYYQGAIEFVDIVERALRSVGRDFASVGKCLEVGCGYGRIVRVLSERLPAERIYACDVIAEGAEFTAEEFGANAYPLAEEAPERDRESFDLIYLLSVYTHMKESDVVTNLRAVARLLKPGGALVFTAHGPLSARKAEIYSQFWLDKAELNRQLDEQGYYYGKYPYYRQDYGLTWFTEARLRALVEKADLALEFVSCSPAELDEHQDVYVYQKG